jgi:hypothetical protein
MPAPQFHTQKWSSNNSLFTINPQAGNPCGGLFFASFSV